MKEKQPLKNKLILFVTLLFVYIALFEFILPINKVIPKPTLFFESLENIWNEYGLVYALTLSGSVVYLSILCAYIHLYLGVAGYLKFLTRIEGSLSMLRAFIFLTPLFFVLLFNYWFPQNILGEFVFAFIVSSFWMLHELLNESKRVKEEYILVGKNLNLTPTEILEKIYWNSAQPELFEKIKKINYSLWLLILMYEFVGNSHGVGQVYRTAYSYNDFTALYALAIVTAIIIWLGDFMIAQIKRKFIHWNA